MTLCKTHNGAQCTCQPDEGVPCEFEKTKTILQIAEEEGLYCGLLPDKDALERVAARIRAE